MSLPVIRLFDPASAPCSGMNSAIAPAALGAGYFSQLTNIRFPTMQMKVRNGISKLNTALPNASASFRGAWSGYIGTTLYNIAAYRIGSYTEVFAFNSTAGTWTELTADGTSTTYGNFQGNTRFPTDGKVSYAVITTPDHLQTLVMQNGADEPRIYDPSQTTYPPVSIHQAINPPTSTATQTVTLSWPECVPLWENGTRNSTTFTSSNYVNINAATNASPIVLTTSSPHGVVAGQTIGVSGVEGNTAANGIWVASAVTSTTITLANSAGNYAYILGGIVQKSIAVADLAPNGADMTPALSIPPTVLTNDFCEIDFDFGTALQLTNSRQLIMVVNTTYGALWDNVAVSVGAISPPGVYTTIYNPNSSVVEPAFEPNVDPNNAYTYAVGFSVDGLANALPQSAATRVRFTWVGASPPATQITASIYCIAASGLVQGTGSYAVSWYNEGSRAESFGLVLPYPTTASIQNQSGAPLNGLSIPNSDLLYYEATISYQNVSATEIQHGTDTLNLYRQDPGDLDYYLAQSHVVNNFSSGSNSWNTGSALEIFTVTDSTASSAKDYTRTVPSAYHQCIPIGSSMIGANSRLYVGGVGTSKSQIWVSENLAMCSFLPSVAFLNANQVDPTSAVMVQFPGETVTGFGFVGGGLIGVNPIFVFTNINCYRLDGIDATSLSAPSKVAPDHGCNCPWSIASHSGNLYWIDVENQLVRMAGSQIQQVSRYKVDNKFAASPSLASATGVWFNQRFYLGYTPSGGSVNTNTLVYEELYDEWTEDVYSVGNAAQYVKVFGSPTCQVFMYDTAGNVYSIEQPNQTTDAGNPINIMITTPELHGQMWNWCDVGRIGIVSDISSNTLTISRTWKPLSSGQSGSINISNAGSDTTAYLWEHISGDQHVGGSGLSVITSISGTMPGGSQIYSLVYEFAARGDDKAQNG